MEKLGDILGRNTVIFLPDPHCIVCRGSGEYVYGGSGKRLCKCEHGLLLPLKEWLALGKPKDVLEFDRLTRVKKRRKEG